MIKGPIRRQSCTTVPALLLNVYGKVRLLALLLFLRLLVLLGGSLLGGLAGGLLGRLLLLGSAQDNVSLLLHEVDGLVDSQILLDSGSVNQALDLVSLHLVSIGNALDLSLELLLGSLDGLLGNDGLHSQTHLDLLVGLLTELLLELVHGHAHILQVLLKLEALLGDAVLEVLHQLLDAALDHSIGDVGLHAVHDLIDQVVNGMKADIPDAMIESRIEELVQDFQYRISQQGLKLEQYLQYMGMTMDQFKEQFREQADKQVKMRLAMEAIVAKESIEATEEEFEAEIKRIADAYQMEADKVKSLVDAAAVKKDLAVNKAIDFVKEKANIVLGAAEEKKPAKKTTRKTTKKAAAKKDEEPKEEEKGE